MQAHQELLHYEDTIQDIYVFMYCMWLMQLHPHAAAIALVCCAAAPHAVAPHAVAPWAAAPWEAAPCAQLLV